MHLLHRMGQGITPYRVTSLAAANFNQVTQTEARAQKSPKNFLNAVFSIVIW